MICKYSLALLSLLGHFHDAKGLLPRNKISIHHGLSSTHWATVIFEKKQDHEFLDEMEEIDALGGDSFFMESSTDKDKPEVHANSDERISQIEAMGGDPFFLSDDDVEDDDYSDTLDFDGDTKDQDNFSAEAALNMMAMSSALGGGVMDLIDPKDEIEKNPVEKQTSQDSKVTSSTSLLEAKYDQVMEMGGDPFFLSDDDDDDGHDDENDENVADGVKDQNDDDDDDDDGALTPEAFLAMAYSKVPNDDDDDLVQDDKDDDGALTPEAFLAMAYSKVPTKENGEIAGTSALSATMEDHNDDKDNDDNGDNGWEWDGSIDEDAHMGF